ncbi:hypothetical protein K4K52_002159 [Colletotrichum sp. SAR 10_76]|nr:hypothetical protein K4K52_002159 [Colletotrichum sp. SAR 10_76]
MQQSNDSQKEGAGAQQQMILPIMPTFEDVIRSAIAGRTSAQIAPEVRAVLDKADPETREMFMTILVYVTALTNESKAKTASEIRNAVEARENYIKAKNLFTETAKRIDERVKKAEAVSSEALMVAELARSSFELWDKNVQEQLKDMFDTRMRELMAEITQKLSNQVGRTTTEAIMRELTERIQTLENGFRKDLATNMQNMEGYVQRELAQMEQRVEEKVTKEMEEDIAAREEKIKVQEEKVKVQEEKIKVQEEKIKILEAKIEKLMNRG